MFVDAIEGGRNGGNGGNEGSNESADHEDRRLGTARDALQNAAELLSQVELESIPFASLRTAVTDNGDDPTTPPSSTPILPWTSDLTHLHASLRTSALALAEIAPSTLEQVAEFDATILDWRRDSMIGGWVPGIRCREGGV